jgi:predicted N-acyltransferase
MNISIIDTLDEVLSQEWNALDLAGNPFLRHEFLANLERHDCLGQRWGWLPQHVLLRDDSGRLLGASPLYIKTNSYGELVFDWSWAEAYERSGLAYYPKLVTAVPYTPVSGPRLLVAPGGNAHKVRRRLTEATLEHAQKLGVSSMHWLFTTPEETQLLEEAGMAVRLGCQFHWENQCYRDFADYLDRFTSKKRKQIRRERRRVAEAGIEIRTLRGNEISEEQWDTFHRHYRSTFERKSGYATLSQAFFHALATEMPENVLLVAAYDQGRHVASALSLCGHNGLFGRHWGCDADYADLHFEACYYQGLDYCIDHGLQRFEPGAQGEHKISRGFLPQATWSAHWIAQPDFRTAIEDFVQREQVGMQHYMQELAEHSPFRTSHDEQSVL